MTSADEEEDGYPSSSLDPLMQGYLDRRHDANARNGRLLRGPSLTSRWRFNWHTKGDGLRFRLANQRNLLEWLRPGESGKDLVIKRDREAHHIQIAGDTGTGKSTLVRQIVYQIAARNEVAIIFDPDREYIREFFRESHAPASARPADHRGGPRRRSIRPVGCTQHRPCGIDLNCACELGLAGIVPPSHALTSSRCRDPISSGSGRDRRSD